MLPDTAQDTVIRLLRSVVEEETPVPDPARRLLLKVPDQNPE